VSYYICHRYRSAGDKSPWIPHFFAVCKWFTWPGQKVGGVVAQTAMNSFFNRKGMTPSSLCKETYGDFPVLSVDVNPDHTQDVVAVQRISHRWIPGKLPRSVGGARSEKKHKQEAKENERYQLAYPVPTRVHA